MGFYSFYKIIKDMLRTLFGKKFLKITIVIFLIFTIFFVYNECFAFTNDELVIPNIGTIKLNEWYDNYYWFIYCGYYNGVNYAGMLVSDTEFTFEKFGEFLRIPGTHNTYYNFNSLRSSVNLNFMKSCININEPTLTSKTNDLYAPASDIPNVPKFSNFDIKYTNGNTFLNATNPRIINPILTNTQTELENLSFNNFNVEANSYSNQDVYMLFYNRSLSNSQTTEGLYPISTKLLTRQSIYYDPNNSSDDNSIYNIPIWKTGVLFNVGSTYEIKFAIINGFDDENNVPLYSYIGDTYSFTISSNVTQDYINQLNQQTVASIDEDNQQQINNSLNEQTNAINNQTQSIDNINNTISNSTVDSSSIDLPTDNTQDPTQSGVDNIFQTIYNSFTSGTAQDIVFPIPFTNKNITLQANYIYNMLNNNGASWIITIIQAFWWYLISRFIITDIMKKIRKIKQGNFDNIQNSNIKEDML